MIYFDQAASSFPKPSEVIEAMVDVMENYSANPGRGEHSLARNASDVIQKTREKAASLFGLGNPKRALFYPNATVALNQAIKGLPWNEGGHVIATSLEHNSIRRPLEYIKENFAVEITYIPWNGDDFKFVQDVQLAIRPDTKLFAMTHASNVTGVILPLQATLRLAREREILTLVDASQTAGHIPIDMQQTGVDMLAFPGHKGLLGPQGTGMLLVEKGVELKPIHHGGTGSFSDNPNQPEHWPERLESGTLNTPGVAGLYAALNAFEQRLAENVPRETLLVNQLQHGLKNIKGVHCYGPTSEKNRMPIVAFNIMDISSQEIAMALDSHYGIAVRAGIHCSPLAHETLNTANQGVIRASLSIYNTEEEVETFLQAVREIATAYQEL